MGHPSGGTKTPCQIYLPTSVSFLESSNYHLSGVLQLGGLAAVPGEEMRDLPLGLDGCISNLKINGEVRK